MHLLRSLALRARGATTDVRAFDVVLAICAVSSIVPLFCARHLPMADLAEHLASMATIRHYGDASFRSAEYFTIAGVFETPYWLYHAIGAGLTALLGSAERANVLMLSIVGLGYPYALRSLLVALRRDARLAIFGCALFWSTNLLVGLLNFVASVPVVLAGLALVVRQAEAPSPRRWIGLAALATGLLYLHLSSFALFVVDAAVIMWLLPAPVPGLAAGAELRRRLLRLPLRLLWLAPAGVLGTIVFFVGRTIGHGSGPAIVYFSRATLVKGLFSWLFDGFKSRVDDVLGLGLVALLLGLGLVSWWERRRGCSTDREDAWHERCAWILAMVAVLVWLGSPSDVGSDAKVLDVRMGVFVGIFAILLPRVAPTRRTAIAFAGATACVLGLAANTAYEVYAFERDDVGNFDALLRAMPRGKRLVYLNLEPRSTHVNVHVFPYFGSYYRARYGGVASYSFSETSHWPVQYRPEMQPPSRMAWANACTYRNEHDGAYFDYALVHGERDPLAATPPGPRWELIGRSRLWRLYRKSATEPPVPPGDSPDRGPCG